jgi:hypothetical protein
MLIGCKTSSPTDANHSFLMRLERSPLLYADEVKQNYQNLLQTMSSDKHLLGALSQGIEHFIKITTSYWSGLFHCYEIEDLPRTNNDLEQTFGVLRHHQRRCTGRKVAPSSLVIRGSVQLTSAVATKFRSFTAEDLSQVSFSDLSELRNDLKKHHNARIEQFQFRRNPSEYLATLESMLL